MEENRGKQSIPECINKMEEGVKILVNSCTRKKDRMHLKMSDEHSAPVLPMYELNESGQV